MLSFGMFSARAASTAARKRGFIAGSGVPILAETVISRASFPNSLDFAASCRPLRCMMFLNCECPAMKRVIRRVAGKIQNRPRGHVNGRRLARHQLTADAIGGRD